MNEIVNAYLIAKKSLFRLSDEEADNILSEWREWNNNNNKEE